MFLDQLVDQAGTGSQLLVSLQRQASVTSTCSQLTAMSADGNTFSNIANGIQCNACTIAALHVVNYSWIVDVICVLFTFLPFCLTEYQMFLTLSLCELFNAGLVLYA